MSVERTYIGFETSVDQKPTFSGQYLLWESFSSLKQNNLISSLVHLALMICIQLRNRFD